MKCRQLCPVPGRLLAIFQCIAINVLACTVSHVRSLSSSISFFSVLVNCVLILHLVPILCHEMLGNLVGWFHRIVSWRAARPAYDIFDVIVPPFMTCNRIHGVLLWRILNSLLFRSCAPTCFPSLSTSVSSVGVLFSSIDDSSSVGATISQSTDAVLCKPSLPNVNVVGVTSISRNIPVLAYGRLLYDSVARRPVADVVIGSRSRYT